MPYQLDRRASSRPRLSPQAENPCPSAVGTSSTRVAMQTGVSSSTSCPEEIKDSHDVSPSFNFRMLVLAAPFAFAIVFKPSCVRVVAHVCFYALFIESPRRRKITFISSETKPQNNNAHQIQDQTSTPKTASTQRTLFLKSLPSTQKTPTARRTYPLTKRQPEPRNPSQKPASFVFHSYHTGFALIHTQPNPNPPSTYPHQKKISQKTSLNQSTRSSTSLPLSPSAPLPPTTVSQTVPSFPKCAGNVRPGW